MPTNTQVFQWLDAMFANQSYFYNTAIDTWSFATLRAQLSALSVQATGVNISQALLNPAYNMNARLNWKLGCQRGVTGTPTIFINGALTGIDESWTVSEWQALINGLLAGSDDL